MVKKAEPALWIMSGVLVNLKAMKIKAIPSQSMVFPIPSSEGATKDM